MDTLFASNNIHKRDELSHLLKSPMVMPKDIGVDFAPDEIGSTFLENAMIKAKELYRLSGRPVLADDSGLRIDALPDLLGVHTARFASTLGQAARNALVLEHLAGVSTRGARFVCCLVYYVSPERFFIAQEELVGSIAETLWEGGSGFGYDPIFIVPIHGKRLSEFSMEEKNALSHRGRAAMALSTIIKREICGL